ncbi:hypothetical protein [Nocardia cyriacigeorgica]|uniref:hypothetical protein n=1 Tax=Nocardia cyriacigeorgica TaxID=135487 RepID=UPI002454871B|nr:hypothetical protein [Nocardia cyriacigeorgica]
MDYTHRGTVRREEVSYKVEGAEPIKFSHFDRPLIPEYITVRWQQEDSDPWFLERVFVNGPWLNKNGTPSKRKSSGNWAWNLDDLTPELLELVESSKPKDED